MLAGRQLRLPRVLREALSLDRPASLPSVFRQHVRAVARTDASPPRVRGSSVASRGWGSDRALLGLAALRLASTLGFAWTHYTWRFGLHSACSFGTRSAPTTMSLLCSRQLLTCASVKNFAFGYMSWTIPPVCSFTVVLRITCYHGQKSLVGERQTRAPLRVSIIILSPRAV